VNVVDARPTTPPATDLGPFRRFALLVGLRRRLLFRGPRKGAWGKVLYALVAIQVLFFAGLFALGAAALVSKSPEHAGDVARLSALAYFGLQFVLGVMGVAVGEFYDTSRLLHLPVAPREIFSAMSVSSLFSPTALVAAAPFCGVLHASDAGVSSWLIGLACVVGLVWFANATSLLAGYLILRASSRRRLRDLTTIVGGALGLLFFVAFRSITGGDGRAGANVEAIFASGAWDVLRFAPPLWFAEVFARAEAEPRAAIGYAFLGVSAIYFVMRFGGAAFRATYDAGGESGGGSETVAEVRSGLAAFLPVDIAAVVRTTHAVFRREPQLRVLLVQQLAFIAFPLLMQMGSRSEDSPGGEALLLAMAAMIVFSHAAIAMSVFGLDGRGLGMLLAAPISRARLIAGRLVALGSVFAAADLFASAAIVGVARAMRKDFDGAIGEAATLYGLALTGDVVQLGCGAVVSVLAPMRVVRTRRGATTRLGKEGCATALGRLLALIPTGLCVAIVVAIAVAPKWLDLDATWYLATVPAALAFTALLVYACVVFAARALVRREETLLAALAADGD
jgi:hypothetical protein